MQATLLIAEVCTFIEIICVSSVRFTKGGHHQRELEMFLSISVSTVKAKYVVKENHLTFLTPPWVPETAEKTGDFRKVCGIIFSQGT